MSWKLDRPLFSLADDEMNKQSQYVWEHESLGGIAENNNPLPRPVITLLLLTYFTAMAITFPLYGQRPNAAIYADYVSLMNSTEVQKVLANKAVSHEQADKQAMALIENALAHFESPYTFQRIQHPIDMNKLRSLAPEIIELRAKGVDLREYNVVGNHLSLANFEGNIKANGEHERLQPWWDKGFTIAVWWFIIFCLAVIVVVKRLPHYSWRPDHSIAH